jgi:hypothetical protein
MMYEIMQTILYTINNSQKVRSFQIETKIKILPIPLNDGMNLILLYY